MNAPAARVIALALMALPVAGLLTAPPATNTVGLMLDLFAFRGPDPWVTAVFNLMGVWPLLYARVLLQGTGRAWLPKLLVFLSFFVGAFVLMPAVALRRFGAPAVHDPSWVRWFCDSRAVGSAIGVAGFALLAYGAAFGDLGRALEVWRTDGFVWTFGLDFAALTFGFPVLLLAERQS